MPDYKSRNTQILEARCVQSLHDQGLQVSSNNSSRYADPDLLVEGELWDFQYSCDFAKWGDLRVDIISAYSDVRWQPLSEEKTFEEFLHARFRIDRLGKIFDRQIKMLVYWVFNQPESDLIAETDKPKYIYQVPTKDLLYLLRTEWRELIKQKRFKTNFKGHLGDRHGSAFCALNFQNLLDRKIGWV